jgi:hypothetical protein
MTPKQKYDERKRLRAERLLRKEQDHAAGRSRTDVMDEKVIDALDALVRIADALDYLVERDAQ